MLRYLSIGKFCSINTAKGTFTNNVFLTKAVSCSLKEGNSVWSSSYWDSLSSQRSIPNIHYLNWIFWWWSLYTDDWAHILYRLLLLLFIGNWSEGNNQNQRKGNLKHRAMKNNKLFAFICTNFLINLIIHSLTRWVVLISSFPTRSKQNAQISVLEQNRSCFC